MSTAPSESSPTPLPPVERTTGGAADGGTQEALLAKTPIAHAAFPKPKLRLECRLLEHEGANVFFSNTNAATILSSAVSTVLATLYSTSRTNDRIPGTRSVTLVLRPMQGVAYTSGTELDDDHKEIHLSLDYVKGTSSRNAGKEAREIEGVLVHEMVHCWQWNGSGTAPGGLIEGIADYVRLRAGLEPPHWKREVGGQWDAGYQHTGYFLDWLEGRTGPGSVRRINNALKREKYEKSLWQELFGKSVEGLWGEYQDSMRPSET